MNHDNCQFAFLAHLGYNMWGDPAVDVHGVHAMDQSSQSNYASDHLRFDFSLFDSICRQLSDAGCSLLVLDVGEGMQYESHPEISCKGAVSKEWIHDTVRRLRGMGIEVVPKLNFSACHDQWMGEYGRMLSTTPYYQFCQDVIAEVAEAFDRPRLFHLGMDEECPEHQQYYNMMIVRQGELWWHDFHFLASVTMQCGCRPWIWSDFMWNHEEEFLRNMSREIVQSNWYYGYCQKENNILRCFEVLEEAGFDQIPTGSVWAIDSNFGELADYVKPRISERHLLGLMQAPWPPMTEDCRKQQEAGVRTIAEVRQKWGLRG